MRKPAPEYDSRFVFRPEADTDYRRFENALAHPFVARPVGRIPRINAWWLAEAALVSYSDPAVALAAYAEAGLKSQPISKDGTDAYVAWNDEAVIVAFRGTEPDHLEDYLTDANLALVKGDSGHVHLGFKLALEAVWPPLMEALGPLENGRSVWFCGHSLGAALATLAAAKYGRTTGACTLGSPRVGDPEFAGSLDAKLSGGMQRFVNNHDIVTHVPTPPLYKHVRERRFIGPDGRISERQPSIPHFFADLIGTPAELGRLVRALDQQGTPFAPRFLLDHMPKAYAIWTWNDYEANG
jgi:hypothetical protein